MSLDALANDTGFLARLRAMSHATTGNQNAQQGTADMSRVPEIDRFLEQAGAAALQSIVGGRLPGSFASTLANGETAYMRRRAAELLEPAKGQAPVHRPGGRHRAPDMPPRGLPFRLERLDPDLAQKLGDIAAHVGN